MSSTPEPFPLETPPEGHPRWTDNPLSSAGYRLPRDQYLAQTMIVVGADGVERRGTMADFLRGDLQGP